MYLKSIEVQGFKSFANKIKFDFHEGITGIVGPNGSGKSNVADAVRWVLGEQRIKQLRGGKMEDVIFAGTENRKPLGFAQVDITLDNSDHKLAIDYEEVTVSRKLFRSGESEYRMNGTICRLRDIHELFYDTGIGKEGYSIIGQGQIDKILSGKADERRELFDEAAGIVKFKRRKAETLKKLENEKQNLLRVTDILSELEKRVKPLERQAANAKAYLDLKEELKNYDIQVFLQESGQINKQLEEVLKNKNIAQNELDDKKQQLETIRNTYEKLETYLEELNHKIDEKKNVCSRLDLEKQKLDGEIKVLYEQISSSKASEVHCESRMEAVSEALAEYDKEKEKYLTQEQELLKFSIQAKSLQEDAQKEQEGLENRISELETKIEEKKQEIIRILNQETLIKTNMQRYDTMLEQVRLRKEEIAKKMTQFESDEHQQKELIAQLQQELSTVNRELAQNMETQEALEAEIQKLSNRISEDKRLQSEIISQYHKQNSNLEALKNLTERYEGYGNSIRKIMELKDRKKGIIGVVADIIKVEKKYETAIETALGGNIQNIVTDNEVTAKEVIEYLKKNKYGRATFLPLNSIANKTGFNNEKVFSEKGVIGLACDLITIDEKCENIGKYLLGRIVVVDTVDNALALARKFHYTLRIVTLEGELLNAGGSMSGGAFKNNSNLLSRRREIDELEKSVKELKAEEAACLQAIAENEKQLSAKKAEFEKLRVSMNGQYLMQNTAKLNLNQAQAKKEELAQNQNDFRQETEGISSQITEIDRHRESILQELAQCEEQNRQIEQDIEKLNEEVEKQKQLESQKAKETENLRMDLSGLMQKQEFVKENLERVVLESAKLLEEQKQLKQQQREAGTVCKEREEQIAACKKQSEEIGEQSGKLLQEVEELQKKREGQSKEQRTFFAKRENLSEQIAGLDKELYRLSANEEKLQEAKEKIANYMWDEYELTYGTLKASYQDELKPLTELKKLVSSMKNKIRSLGSVNLESIEEYQSVSERYTFLKEQHNDLTISSDHLEKIILELDTGMRKQFQEKFEDIRREFDKVFKILFGGGKGSIALSDAEDVLEAEITIISQPPGKKLQNMMQLSGGEKALTAIALLFAIQNLKPSPFCLLDEIEAALDDSNVVRYASYLHKLTDHTQFIVITHRRGTMNAADRLYGITMQEKGISTLVSVDLIEGDLDKTADHGKDG